MYHLVFVTGETILQAVFLSFFVTIPLQLLPSLAGAMRLYINI